MKALLLSPYPERISSIIEATDNLWSTAARDIGQQLFWADFVVSFGYRHIIRNEQVFEHFGPRIINLHIAYLPFNRGADPVYWALRDDTPMGVTIHVMAKGVDTGPILAQMELHHHRPNWRDEGAVKALKAIHYAAMCDLFAKTWPALREGKIEGRKQGPGTYHYVRDKHVCS